MKTCPLVLSACLLAACGAQSPASATADPPPAAAAPAAIVQHLPLERGFYVRDGTPCAQASNATLLLHGSAGINGAHEACEFTRIEQTAPDTFAATQTCRDIAGGEAETATLTYGIASPTAFTVRSEEYGWQYTAEHCPQSSLPDPWRDNDISDL